jgi:hypothetical protein
LRVNFGMQHEFPGGLILKTNYVGSFGRRLLAQADANQLVEFPDKQSGQLMSQAIGNITTQLRAGVDPHNVTVQPWLEHQVTPGKGVSNGYTSNTALEAVTLQSLLIKGDFADTIQSMSPDLGYNVGMAAQFGENTVYTNKGFSSYHGLLVTLSKNMSHGLQFDVNYTWAHSIDNVSLIANGVAFGGYGFVCDVQRPRLCRGDSDFDTTHYINGNFTYSLPFGHGRSFGAQMPWGLDNVLGGWDISGIPSWHSGQAYSAVTSAFVAGFANDAPAIFDGNTAALRHQRHKTAGGQEFLFADPEAAASAFTGPVGFQIGSRNQLRGPQFFNVDTGLAKSFRIPMLREANLKLRADAFNVLNHPNFTSPGGNPPTTNPPTNYQDITQPGSFGQLASLVTLTGAPRVLQLALRLEF